MDYTKIEASQVWGEEIGRLYLNASPFITTAARLAYESMAEQVEIQYRTMVERHGMRVIFQEEDPYDTWGDMVQDIVENKTLRVYHTSVDQAHPLLGVHMNDMFRAVHDYYGHYGAGNGHPVSFSRHGEEAAWVRHSQMFAGTGRRAMTTETRGQNSAFIWINGGKVFPAQKAILLPDWVARIPEQYYR